MNFDPDVWHFVAFLAVAVLVNVAAGTLVAALSIPFDSLGSANLCATILMLVLLLLNGALLNLSDAPDLVGMVQSLSFFRFGFQAMLGNELHDKVVMIQAPGVRRARTAGHRTAHMRAAHGRSLCSALHRGVRAQVWTPSR